MASWPRALNVELFGFAVEAMIKADKFEAFAKAEDGWNVAFVMPAAVHVVSLGATFGSLALFQAVFLHLALLGNCKGCGLPGIWESAWSSCQPS